MRVMAYPRYAALGASSRVRWLQFLPELRRLGLNIDVSPLLDDEYLRLKYAGRPTLGAKKNTSLALKSATCLILPKTFAIAEENLVITSVSGVQIRVSANSFQP